MTVRPCEEKVAFELALNDSVAGRTSEALPFPVKLPEAFTLKFTAERGRRRAPVATGNRPTDAGMRITPGPQGALVRFSARWKLRARPEPMSAVPVGAGTGTAIFPWYGTGGAVARARTAGTVADGGLPTTNGIPPTIAKAATASTTGQQRRSGPPPRNIGGKESRPWL